MATTTDTSSVGEADGNSGSARSGATFPTDSDDPPGSPDSTGKFDWEAAYDVVYQGMTGCTGKVSSASSSGQPPTTQFDYDAVDDAVAAAEAEEARVRDEEHPTNAKKEEECAVDYVPQPPTATTTASASSHPGVIATKTPLLLLPQPSSAATTNTPCNVDAFVDELEQLGSLLFTPPYDKAIITPSISSQHEPMADALQLSQQAAEYDADADAEQHPKESSPVRPVVVVARANRFLPDRVLRSAHRRRQPIRRQSRRPTVRPSRYQPNVTSDAVKVPQNRSRGMKKKMAPKFSTEK